MSVEIKVPVLPESVSDATVAAWHKQPGDTIRRDENLVDLETDKVVLEVPSPCDGVLKEIAQESGQVVTTDTLLGVVEAGEISDVSADRGGEQGGSSEETSAPSEAHDDELSPSVRRLVDENNLNPSLISGTGRDGRLTKEDVLNHMKSGSPAKQAATTQSSTSAEKRSVQVSAGAREVERVPMSRLRQRIAERMNEAQSTAAMLTSFNEVNLKAVMGIRAQHKAAFEEKHGTRLGLMSFFVKACTDALRKFPVVNASVDGNDVLYHGYQDIGIAVNTDRGLIVPVLRNAEMMGFADIESAIRNYAKKAREGSIQMQDLQGGTFTITNGGVFGSLISTPILNMPQSAILGMHTIKERPIVENGEVIAAPMMYIALTYDHRIIDGASAVQFLVAIKDSLEDPSRLMLNI